MINKDLLDILCCPETKEPVVLAEQTLVDKLNVKITNGEIKNRGGQKVTVPIQGGLVRKDNQVLYPIRDGIPIMLINEAIPLV